MIHWTDALRAQVTPRTAEDAGPRTPVDRAWRLLQKKRAKGQLHRWLRVDALSKNDSAGRAVALLEGEAWPEEAPAIDVAVLLLSGSRVGIEGADIFALLESHGSTYALKCVLEATLALGTPHEAMSWYATAVHLRLAILREPPDDAIAVEGWKTSTDDRQLLLAMAFPDKPEWAAEVATRMSHAPHTGFALRHIFMSLRDLTLATSLLAKGTCDSFLDLVATFGDDALPMLLAYAPSARWKSQRKALALALSAYESEDVAKLFVKWLPKKEVRVIATEWFARFPKIGEAALKAGKGRFAIKILEQRDHADDVIDPAMEATIEELPDVVRAPPWVKRSRGAPKSAYSKPTRPPTLPGSWSAVRFHRPRLKDGKPLPLDAVDTIGRMLKISTLNERWAGLADVIEACDPRSLAEFVWDVAQAWELGGKKKAELWMLNSLAHFANEEVTRRTTPAITDRRIVDVLQAIGTDAAALELMTIAVREDSMSSAAEYALGQIAEDRDLSKDALEDALTPTLGLDEEGALSLDFGSERHRVGFDTRLEPYVLKTNGERLANLPPRKKKDDPKKVDEARRHWKDLKEDVATIADRRLESAMRAMVEGRSWSLGELRRAWIDHPLLRHMARGILWMSKSVVFRVCEDQTFADDEDRPVLLADDAEIRVPSARQLGPAGVARWRRLFEDYKILQSFDQLGEPPT